MVREFRKGDKILYVCECDECGLAYAERELDEKCQSGCQRHT